MVLVPVAGLTEPPLGIDQFTEKPPELLNAAVPSKSHNAAVPEIDGCASLRKATSSKLVQTPLVVVHLITEVVFAVTAP